MMPRVMLVDDEPHILSGYRRGLRKHFEVFTNDKPAAALREIVENGPFAVVISDYRMPDMDGVTFLTKVRETAPDTVRIMLTGQADQAATIAAINSSDVFRFLTKPCPPETLIATIELAAEHYRLLHSERELLDGTLQQIVRVLIELIGLVDPAVHKASSEVQKLVAQMCAELGLDNAWEYELAAQVSQLGTVALPASMVERHRAGVEMNPADRQVFDGHPQSAYNLLVQIPRLGRVARMVLTQMRPPGSRPRDLECGDEDDIVAAGAHLLNIATDFQQLLAKGKTPAQSIESLRNGPGPPFRGKALDALAGTGAGRDDFVHASLRVDQLEPGYILKEAIKSPVGLMLLAGGHEITAALIERVRRYAETSGVAEPIKALIPAQPR